MNRFFNLLSKEIKSLFNMQFIIPMIAVFAIFALLGNVMGDVTEETIKDAGAVNILNLDDTEYTNKLVDSLSSTYTVTKKNAALIQIENIDVTDKDAVLEAYKCDSLVIIPKGFADSVSIDKKPTAIETISRIKGVAAMSSISSAMTDSVIPNVNDYITAQALKDSGFTEKDAAFLESPTFAEGYTVVDDKAALVSADSIVGYLAQTGVIIPIVVFILVMFTSQMIISSVSSEKIDKTLETLLSAPIPRSSIIWSKMMAAAAVAIVSGIVYMLGFQSFMGGLTDATMAEMVQNATGEAVSMKSILDDLGLSITTIDYVLVGVQMLLTVLISLCVSMILGALVNDPKSAQVVIMPIMFAALIPYIITLVIDLDTLPAIARYVLYAIPFTHTFISLQNIIFGNWAIYAFGLLYQVIFFIVAFSFAKGLFNSDKILTISLNFGQKNKYRRKKGAKTAEIDE
ncbi:MAG: ABC transporter permease [Oscillospiraceae bacterium]|jgi:ABC-2 type transport system permease protein|nr:ABC transporter permease [Oscillospiraceae bacterium]